jgi:hypothetical protein
LRRSPFQPALAELTAIVKPRMWDKGSPAPSPPKLLFFLSPISIQFRLISNTANIAMQLSPTALSPPIENSCRCLHWMLPQSRSYSAACTAAPEPGGAPDKESSPELGHSVGSALRYLKINTGYVLSFAQISILRSQVICLVFYCQDICYITCNYKAPRSEYYAGADSCGFQGF